MKKMGNANEEFQKNTSLKDLRTKSRNSQKDGTRLTIITMEHRESNGPICVYDERGVILS
jgi:hypothetical protein|uniref:Uncharacterized protein n=1 Tax=Siphoviridae sp. ctm7X10 TaxID=2827929 RepID=A0A8S5S5K7_9CAUD|nr:MAG TPA: hypothetical protein [Siphoviridae sp. ctm7X10]